MITSVEVIEENFSVLAIQFKKKRERKKEGETVEVDQDN